MSEERVIELLSKRPYLTTLEVSENLSVSRNTAIKLLEVMVAKGIIDFRKAGPAKLWFVKASEEEERKKAREDTYKSVKHAYEKAREKMVYSGPTLKLLEKALREMENKQEQEK